MLNPRCYIFLVQASLITDCSYVITVLQYHFTYICLEPNLATFVKLTLHTKSFLGFDDNLFHIFSIQNLSILTSTHFDGYGWGPM